MLDSDSELSSESVSSFESFALSRQRLAQLLDATVTLLTNFGEADDLLFAGLQLVESLSQLCVDSS